MSQSQYLFHYFLNECLWRGWYFLLALVLCFLYCYHSFEFFFFFLSFPLTDLYPCQDKQFIFTDMGEAFSTSFFCSAYFACLFCFPLFLYLSFCFLRPSLYAYESGWLFQHIFYISFFLFFSLAVSYMFSLPLFWSFFTSFDESQSLDLLHLSRLRLEARISTYIFLTLNIFLMHHLFFIFPFFLLLVKKFTNISFKAFPKLRRRFCFFNLFLAAIFSPPDFSIQFTLFVLFFICTEIIFIFFFFYESFSEIKGKKEKNYF